MGCGSVDTNSCPSELSFIAHFFRYRLGLSDLFAPILCLTASGRCIKARFLFDSPAAEPGPQPGRPRPALGRPPLETGGAQQVEEDPPDGVRGGSAGHSQAGAEPAAQFVRHHEFIFLPKIIPLNNCMVPKFLSCLCTVPVPFLAAHVYRALLFSSPNKRSL